ncbi:MAG: DASS family sodium-coupled anion symporter [Phycisphaerales bacterium]
MHATETSASDVASRRPASSILRLALGPALAAAAYVALGSFVGPEGLSEAGRLVGCVLVWMGAWWLTEAIPLPATALLPLVLLPATGSVSMSEAAAPYASRIIFLFMGGFMLALAMQKHSLHKRIALVALSLIGGSPARMIAGFMITTAALSMWVSNTATTVMMLPIASSVVALVQARAGGGQHNFATALMLGIAYSASIGGLATPIGSPPNAILLGFLQGEFGYSISFVRWMMMGLPITLVFLPLTWALLVKVLHPPAIREIPGGRAFIRDELRSLGRMSTGERVVMAVFFATVACWLGRGFVAEMDNAFGAFVSRNVDDAAIAIASSIALFVIPVDLKRGEFALDWKTAEGLPWGVLLLFGGGLSLAAAVKSSGLDAFIGGAVSSLAGTPTLLIVIVSVAIVVFLTEMTSNTATATIFVSILTGVALVGLGIDPLLLIVPATLASSCAFMMPVATPPNAIVYGTGWVTMRQMARAGFALNIVSILLATVAVYTVVSWVLGIDFQGVPAWAQEAGSP